MESRTPEGRKGDLRLTRIKSPDTGQLLIFKVGHFKNIDVLRKTKEKK